MADNLFKMAYLKAGNMGRSASAMVITKSV